MAGGSPRTAGPITRGASCAWERGASYASASRRTDPWRFPAQESYNVSTVDRSGGKMKQLRIPGPTPCPEAVLQAVAQPMINHRGPQFQALMERVTTRLKEFFNTKNDLFILTGSGTGGMEAAVVNHLSPGDKVLAITNGYFGGRFAGI